MIEKFRAWLREDKSMNNVECMNFDFEHVFLSGWRESFNIKDIDLMQSTGLKDKNGVEIYEGDIVKVTSIQDGEYYTTDVYWGGKDGYPAFDLNAEHISSDWFYDSNILSAVFVNSAYESIEILGNVYENPELLNLR